MENASKALIIAGAILIALLLVGIGVLLISSGSDITDRGTAGMQSQKIQSFNAQFTAYEGSKKGAELKNLESTVRTSNAADASHQVYLKVDASTATSTAKVHDVKSLTSSKTYKVSIKYATGETQQDWSGANIGPVKVENTKQKTENGYVMGIEVTDP